MKFSIQAYCHAILTALAMGASAQAAVAINQITDINNTGVGFGKVNGYSNIPFGVDFEGVYNGNAVAVYTLVGPTGANGAGVSVGISNGENGIASSNNGANVDVNNATPADPVFAAIGNPSGKLENGNAIRMSLWMRQDPLNPITKQPSVEPVLKLELWKEALSGFADYNAVAFPGAGDRIWDTDQNASNSLHVAAGQSQASWVDLNNNGAISPAGKTISAALVPGEWRRVETTLIVDDDPLDDGFGWAIGAEFFDVTAVEEIRAVMFVGDYAGTNLTAGGSFFIDNLLVEVFRDKATMLATPNPNTAPVEVLGLPGDFNNNHTVDAADYTVWRNNLGAAAESSLNGNGDGANGVDAGDYNLWKSHFGNTSPGVGSLALAVPEPASWAVCLLSIGLLASRVNRRR